MTDIFEKIQNDFNEFMKKAKELIEKERVADTSKTKRWKPKCGEYYYTIEWTGRIDSYNWDNDLSDCNCFILGNCFKTHEEAQKELDRMLAERELLDLCDWESGLDNLPSYIIYDTSDCEFYILNHKEVTYNPYRFANEDSSRKAIKQLGTEKLKLIFRID